MLEQAHERSFRERQELKRDAHGKIEASAARIRVKQQRIVQLEKQLRDKVQVEEEVKMYRDQCNALMEQLSSTQTSAPSPQGRSQNSPAVSSPAAAGSVMDRLGQRFTKSLAQINDIARSD